MRAASSGASISSIEASCSHTRVASAPQLARTFSAGLFSAGETAASSTCSVCAQRWPSRLASARELEQALRLRRHTERAARPRRRGGQALEDASADGLRRDAERLKGASGQLLRLREQAEEQVFGPDVVVPERTRLAGGVRKRGARALVEPGRPRLLRRRRDRHEALLGRLLRDPERAPDLRPAAAGRPRCLHEVVDELVGASAQALGELESGSQSFERRRVAPLRLDRADEVRECRLDFQASILT